MSKERKFFKTIYTIEVLSEGPPHPIEDIQDLNDLSYEMTFGEYSGRMLETKTEELSREQMLDSLKEHESDPMFFLLNEDGSDIVTTG